MAVTTGQQAPAFTLPSTQLDPVSLGDYEGQRVLLLFFPGAFTSVCTTELDSVNNELDTYSDADVQVLGISTDSPFALKAFKEKHGFNYPLLSDHDAEVSAAYGAKYDHDFTDAKLDRISKRAAFLIDDDGKVIYAEVLDNAGEQPDFDAIQEHLK